MHSETCPSCFDSALFSTPFCIAFVWTLSLLRNLRNFVTPSVVKNEIYAFIFNFAYFLFGSSKKKTKTKNQNPDLKLPHPYQKSLSTPWVTSDKLSLGKLHHLYRVTVYLLYHGKHLVLFFIFSVLPHAVIMMEASISLPYFLNIRVGTWFYPSR